MDNTPGCVILTHLFTYNNSDLNVLNISQNLIESLIIHQIYVVQLSKSKNVGLIFLFISVLKKRKLFHFSFGGQVDLYPIPSRDQW